MALHFGKWSLPGYAYPPLHGSQPCCGEGVCVTQRSYEPCHAGPTKMDWSQWRVLTKRGLLEEGWQTTPVFLPQELHEQYEKLLNYLLEN